MSGDTDDPIVRALEILDAKVTLWRHGVGDLTETEFETLKKVDIWYRNRSKDLAEQRRIARLTEGKVVLATLSREKYVVVATADGWQVYGDGEEPFT